MTASPQARRRKSRYKVLIALLSLVSGVYAALFYAADALSERDYSGITDPELRVGYCMVSNTSIAEKYLFAETTARAPDLAMYLIVMPYALAGVITEQKKAAILALKERDELRMRAVRWSSRAAESCGYQKVNWPGGTTPLDINMRWLQLDSTFLNFLEIAMAERDAADRVYDALGRSTARAHAATS